MLGSLAALISVFALLAAALYGVRRMNRLQGKSRFLRVLDSTLLGSGQTVAVVQAGGRRFLLGATAQQVALLGELDGDELPAAAETEERGPRLLLSRMARATRQPSRSAGR